MVSPTLLRQGIFKSASLPKPLYKMTASIFFLVQIFKCFLEGFPGGSVVKRPLANAGGRHGFNPWSRKNPQAMGQLSPCITATKTVLQSLGAKTTEAGMPQSLCSATGEITTTRSPSSAWREQPCWPQLEKGPRSNRDPAQPKLINKKTPSALFKNLFHVTHLSNLEKKKKKRAQAGYHLQEGKKITSLLAG